MSIVDLIVVGDIMLGRSFNRKTKKFNPWHSSVTKEINSSDGMIGNLETVITTKMASSNKAFKFKMNPSNIEWLVNLKIVYLSLSNNHSMDYKLEGLKDTIENLNNYAIHSTGAGINRKKACEPTFKILNGIKFGFISAISTSRHYNVSEYVNFVNFSDFNENINFIYQVGLASGMCDHLLVYINWNNSCSNNIDHFTILSKNLINVGARIICGTGLNNILPIVSYQGCLICYSLGNFIDDYTIDFKYENDKGIMLKLKFDKNNLISWKKIPTTIINMEVNAIT